MLYGQGVLCGEHTIFNEQLALLQKKEWRLCGKKYTSLNEVINAAFNVRRSRAEKYYSEAQTYLDTRAFLDALLGNQGSDMFVTRTQNTNLTSPLFMPKALERNEHWHLFYGDVLSLNKEIEGRIECIFKAAQQKLAKSYKFRVFLIITSPTHAVALSKVADVGGSESYKLHNHGRTTTVASPALHHELSNAFPSLHGLSLSVQAYTVPSFLERPFYRNQCHPVIEKYLNQVQFDSASSLKKQSLTNSVLRPFIKTHHLYRSHSLNVQGLSVYLKLALVDMIVATVLLGESDALKKNLSPFYCLELHASHLEYVADTVSDSAFPLSVRQQDGNTHGDPLLLLCIACQYGHLPVVMALLNSGRVDCNKAEDNGATPFYTACEQGHLPVVMALLNSGRVDCNKANNNGTTPFYIACEVGHLPVVMALLNSGRVDCNKANNNGTTPFYIACQQGHLPVVMALLNSGQVDANKANNNGATPFFIACEQGHLPVVKALLNSGRVDCNKAEDDGVTPFYIACEVGHLPVVKVLLNSDRVDCNKANNNGTTPFYIACQMCHLPVVKVLLNSDRVDCNKATNGGATPFYIACQMCHLPVVMAQLNSDRVDWNKADNNGTTPYSIACQMCHLPVMEAIIEKQAHALKEKQAAGKIQAFYRGYCVRKQLPRLREEAVLREQARALKEKQARALKERNQFERERETLFANKPI